jgi:3-deoxy-D-manno-octulosonic-acid transferase
LRAYLAFSAFADVVAPWLLRRRARRGKEDMARIGERLGRAGLARPKGPLIWFHAASLGESLSLLALIGRLRGQRPDLALLITSGTRTSADVLAGRLPAGVVHQFAPIDSAGAVARFLDHWRPDLGVWTESELWPRLIVATDARAIPLLLVNARMSAASARNWARAPGMIGALLGRFSQVLAQDQGTADRLQRLGLPAGRVRVTGTLKEGGGELPHDPAVLAALRDRIGARPVWCAASTHPGEEAIVAAAHARILRDRPDTLLVLAPRHPDRGGAVAAILREAGLTVARRSLAEAPLTQVYLADTLGEMGLWYRLAPRAFVGGSLVAVGGHNPYEPAALGAAILTGPHVANFRDIYAHLHQGGGARLVRDADSLAAGLRALGDPGTRGVQAAAARAICGQGGAATEAALAAILAQVPPPVAGSADQ